MKRLTLAGIIILGAFTAVGITSPKANAAVDCSLVLCRTCPEGQVLSPTGNNCCRCVPIH